MTQDEWRLKFAGEKLIRFALTYDATLKGVERQLQELKLRDLAKEYFERYDAVWRQRGCGK